MSQATHILHRRLEEVMQETHDILSAEVFAGRIESDAAVDKVNHLINLVRKYMATAEAQPASWSDSAPEPGPVAIQQLITPPAPNITTPDLISTEARPAIYFIAIACGTVNLAQVAFLDKEEKQMHLVGGLSKKLSDKDFDKLSYWSKLYNIS